MKLKIILALLSLYLLTVSSALAVSYEINVNIRDEEGLEQFANITFFSVNSNEELASEYVVGNGSFIVNSTRADMKVEFEQNLEILLQNLRISNSNKEIVINFVMPFFENYSTIDGYLIEFPDFGFDNAILKINYQDLGITNESNLQLLKCSNFDSNSYECPTSWSPVPISIDKSSQSITSNLNSFSVYVLVEPDETETNTTTTMTSVTTSATSTPTTSTGQGSAPSNSGSSPQATTTTSVTTSISTTFTSLPTTTSIQTTESSYNPVQVNPTFSSSYVFNSFPMLAILIAIVFFSYLVYSKFKKHRFFSRKRKQHKETKLSFKD